jgi:hypothetical protein
MVLGYLELFYQYCTSRLQVVKSNRLTISLAEVIGRTAFPVSLFHRLLNVEVIKGTPVNGYRMKVRRLTGH